MFVTFWWLFSVLEVISMYRWAMKFQERLGGFHIFYDFCNPCIFILSSWGHYKLILATFATLPRLSCMHFTKLHSLIANTKATMFNRNIMIRFYATAFGKPYTQSISCSKLPAALICNRHLLIARASSIYQGDRHPILSIHCRRSRRPS